MVNPKKPDKIRIQLRIDKSIDKLIDQLAERERRTRSAVVEIALLRYAAATGPDSEASPESGR
jgi:predicted transcriptional regulator